MDFNDTLEEAAFREEARAWLQRHAKPREPGDTLVVNQETGDFSKEFPLARAWQARKYDGGFGAIYFPQDVGGRGGTSMHNMIFMQEEAGFEVPATNHFMIVNRGCCSLLMKYASDALKDELIRPSLRSDLIWCQLFSRARRRLRPRRRAHARRARRRRLGRQRPEDLDQQRAPGRLRRADRAQRPDACPSTRA